MARRRIEVEILGDYSSLQRTFAGASRSAKGFERDLGKSARGAVAASISFRGLGRSIAFASSSFLGGAGIVYGIKSTIAAAEESQRVLGQTKVAVQRSGLSWQKYGESIRNAALAESNISGFDDERLLGTFSQLVRRTGDVNRALKLNALAADVARGRNISLEAAQQLVLKASLGQAGALRRVGIAAEKGASGVQLVDMLSRKYAGSADAYGKTAAGAQDRFRVAVENLQEAIGAGLLPEITKLLNPLSTWLNDSRNQERVQRDVTEATHGMVSVLKAARSVVDGVDKVTGSFKNTLELLLALKVASWARGTAGSFGLIGGSAVTANAEVATLKTSLMGLNALSVAPILIPLEFAVGHKERSLLDKLGKLGAIPKVLMDIGTGGGAITGGNVFDDAASLLRGKKSEPVDTKLSATTGLGPHHAPAAGTTTTTTTGKRGKRPLSLQGQLNLAELAIAEASATKSVKDDLVALRRKAAILRAMIAKGGTLQQQTQRNQDLGSVLDQINSINTKATKAEKTAKTKRPAKKAKAAVTFALPFKLQLAELKAQTTKTDADDRKVAQAEKRFAEKMIKSGKLKGQAVLDAWREIIDANNRLADQQTAQTRQVVQTSTRLLTAGLGLTKAQRLALEQRIAQAEAHRGHYDPGEVGAGGHAVTINVNGAGDPDAVAQKVVKHLIRKSKNTVVSTRGRHGGVSIIP